LVHIPSVAIPDMAQALGPLGVTFSEPSWKTCQELR
jgi:hypothetical protein